MKRDTILVTGGAGYIGSHTAWLLARCGYNVIILDTLYQNQPVHFPWARVVKGDCSDTQLLESLFTRYNITAVMHFAAFLAVGDSVKHPLEYYDNNVSGTRVLLEMMVKHHVLKFIFSSSCAVYGKPQQLPLTESHARNPINPYGKTKYAVEMMLEDCAHAYGLQFVSLRYFNAAGTIPNENLHEWHVPETHIIPLLLQSAFLGKPFSIFGTDYSTPDGTCIRDYVHVQDIAQAHYKALFHLQQKRPSDVFNLGTGVGHSVQELIAAASHITGKEIKIIKADRRPGDPAVLVADGTKASNVLGWKPECSDLETILKTAWITHQSVWFAQQKEVQQ
jgi:UDP-glucose 4-epimerase